VRRGALRLGGSDGTSSEALFRLHRGRPAVLVRTAFAGDTVADITSLRVSAQRRIEMLRDATLSVDLGIQATYHWADRPDQRLECRALPSSSTGTGPSPKSDFDGFHDEAARDAYVQDAIWLARWPPTAAPLPSAEPDHRTRHRR
jgi:hypothetical protein